MANVPNLITKITADNSDFKKKTEECKVAAASMTVPIMGIATAVTAAFAALGFGAGLITKSVFEASDKIGKLVDDVNKIGVSVQAFQELAIAADEVGVSAGSLQNIFAMMNRNLGMAELGTGKARDGLRALGISLSSLNGLSTDQKFRTISAELGKIKDLSLQTSIATMIFGRGAKEAVGMFNSDLDGTINRVKKFGITLTESQGAALDRLSETKNLVGSIWEGFKNNVAAEVAPAYQSILDGILQTVEEMGGMKTVAKDVADFIVGAMNKMSVAINLAVEGFKLAKKTYDAVTFVASDIKTTLWDGPNQGIEQLLQGIMPANSSLSDQNLGKLFGSSASNSVQSNSKNLNTDKNYGRDIAAMFPATSKVVDAYKDTTQKATAALEALKTKAMDAASVLDGFNKIKNTLAAPGQKQADDIINKGVGSLGIKLAPSAEFQALFNQALKEKDTKNSQFLIEKLQDIIDKEANKNSFKVTENEYGFRSDTTGQKQDVSGLVNALNELKTFLAGGANKNQEVQVNIKVEASPDFITTVTKTTSFRDAVASQFDNLLQAAARGR